MTAMQDFAGKTAFVTGAGSGLGLALAGALLRAGAQVMLADRDPARLAAARDRLGDRQRGLCEPIASIGQEVAGHAAILRQPS